MRAGVRARRLGAGERCADDQAAEGGRSQSKVTNSREVDTEPFPALGRRLRELGMYRQVGEKQQSRRERN
jgi:hypothetical protein